jgi:hypothetical protein
MCKDMAKEFSVAENLLAIEKKPKSFHRDHRKEVPGEQVRGWLYHLRKA